MANPAEKLSLERARQELLESVARMHATARPFVESMSDDELDALIEEEVRAARDELYAL